MTTVPVGDVIVTLPQAPPRLPCRHYFTPDGISVCISEGCTLWETNSTAYSWSKGDCVYQGGAS